MLAAQNCVSSRNTRHGGGPPPAPNRPTRRPSPIPTPGHATHIRAVPSAPSCRSLVLEPRGPCRARGTVFAVRGPERGFAEKLGKNFGNFKYGAVIEPGNIAAKLR